MITLTYALSGVLLAGTGYLFLRGYLTPLTQTIAWSVIFFFASAGASAAYLTVSEVFPMEIRAMAIAFFFVVAQGAGILAPWIFAQLIQSSAASVFLGDLVGAGLMLIAAAVEMAYGVKAERQSLENIATPLSAQVGISWKP
jgi:MFS family permease